MNPPDKYDRFARKNCEQKHDGKCIDVIYGITKDKKTEIQALRYPKASWDAADALAHCKSRDGTFEAAGGEEAMYEMSLKDAGGRVQTKVVSGAELADWFKAHTDAEGTVTEEVALFGTVLFGKAKDGAAADAVDWVMSDFTLDRDKERIDPSGWDLKQYKKNPVVLWSHDVMRPAIGRVVSPRVSNGALRGKVQFAPKEIDEFAWAVGEKVKAGFLNAGSVGFRPVKVEMVDPEQEPKEEARAIIRKAELFEFSVCNVPANPAARPVEASEPGKVEEPVEEKAEESLEELPLAEDGIVTDPTKVFIGDLPGQVTTTATSSTWTSDGVHYMRMEPFGWEKTLAEVTLALKAMDEKLDVLCEQLSALAEGLEGAVGMDEIGKVVAEQIESAERKRSYLHDLFQDRGSRGETSPERETSGLQDLFGSGAAEGEEDG